MIYNKEELEKIRKKGEEYVKQKENERLQPSPVPSKSKKGSKFNYFIVALLILSLLLNYFGFQRIKMLEANMEMNMNVIRDTSKQLFDVSEEFYNYKESQKWVSEILFEPNQNESEPDDIVLDVQWSLREIEENATVIFSYKGVQNKEWEEVQATNQDSNTFQASIHLNPKIDYEYRILSKGLIRKASTVEEIPSYFYQLTPVILTGKYSGWSSKTPDDIGELTHFEASYSQENVPFEFYKVKEMKAHFYIEDKLQKTETLTRTKNNNNFDEWSFKADPKFTLIKIEVIYNNGDIQWKEIDPHDEHLSIGDD